MKLIVDIPDDIYRRINITNRISIADSDDVILAVKDGIEISQAAVDKDCIRRSDVVAWLENCTDDSIEHAIDSNLEFIPPAYPSFENSTNFDVFLKFFGKSDAIFRFEEDEDEWRNYITFSKTWCNAPYKDKSDIHKSSEVHKCILCDKVLSNGKRFLCSDCEAHVASMMKEDKDEIYKVTSH